MADNLDDALNLDSEAAPAAQEGDPEPGEGEALVEASIPGEFATGRDIEAGERFMTNVHNAMGWHEIGNVSMVNPTYSAAVEKYRQ